ncbi:MAG: PP2C family protein-serine/threonine phosphatase [Myxococcota bacterium]
MSEFDPLLQRQLRKVGLTEPDQVPTVEQLRDLLGRINSFYLKSAEDRDLLTRSLELSTNEMGELHRQLAGERDRLEQVVIAVSDALGVFGELSRERSQSDERTGTIESSIQVAKRKFTARLTELVGSDGAPTDWNTGHTSATRSVFAIRRSFLSLADQLGELLSQTAHVAAIREQLEVARVVQQMLVPDSSEIDTPSVSVAATFEPAAVCGGDWWTAHPLEGGRMLVVIGDVTGHGISSAILTGVARAACDLGRASVPGDRLTPDRILVAMNAAIFGAARRRFMMTCAAGVLDPARGVMHVANAGHGFPYLVRQGQARPLVVRGSPLGASEVGEYGVVEVPIERGDTVVWYTDGVIECEGPSGDQFSERRLRALCGALDGQPPTEMRSRLLAELNTFRGGKAATDDLTFVFSRIEAGRMPSADTPNGNS